MARRLPVRRSEELLGWVQVTGQDGYWTLGTFEPAPGFEPYRPLFAREQELSRSVADALESEYSAASDEWNAALERINELGLSVGEPGAPARDFKFIGASQVEFKCGVWRRTIRSRVWPDPGVKSALPAGM
jgi:hypothetical protein